ncbi:MAG: hypothetical protein EXS47_02415 [Candidatus Zambryskibacteria bacterium]|nr:hypothetical protein [Candidatus Zambryskibacteria bacterium]
MKRHYYILILLLITITLALVMIGSYYLLLTKTDDINTRNNILKETIGSAGQKQKNFSSVKSLVTDTKSDRDKLALYFVEKDGVADFISSVEKLARAHALDFNVLSIGVEDILIVHASSTQSYLKLKLATKGSWTDTMYFYMLLENLPFKIKFGTAGFLNDVKALDVNSKIKVVLPQWKGEVEVSVVINK